MFVENYVDEKGNVFVPGEKVIVLTTCMHTDSFSEAIFEGVNKRKEYNWKTKTYEEKSFVVISKMRNVYRYDYATKKGAYETKRMKSTLWYNRIFKYDAPLNILVKKEG